MKRKDIKTLGDLKKYYKSISSQRWCMGRFIGAPEHRRHCALGHLGINEWKDVHSEDPKKFLGQRVKRLFSDDLRLNIMLVNDGYLDGELTAPRYKPYVDRTGIAGPKNRTLHAVDKLIEKHGEDYII